LRHCENSLFVELFTLVVTDRWEQAEIVFLAGYLTALGLEFTLRAVAVEDDRAWRLCRFVSDLFKYRADPYEQFG
jgi:hypothetical protein